ncbi:MAG: hypothetical protein IJZ85_00670 [Lachnospiraceae bacterium]|nr:hypothetical protein [Lachnospiraceae bacterium]
MRGLFCGTTARNNEEYRKVVKRRMLTMTILIIVGIATAVTAYMAFHHSTSAISDHTLGIYSGVGFGMAASGLFFLIRDFLLLRNEAKLKQQRLEQTDERLAQIRDLALKPALFTMLFILFTSCLIGSIFYPVLIYILLITVWAFLIVYIIATRYYSRKM